MSLRVRNLQVDVPAGQHAAAVAWWSGALGGVPRTTDEPEYVHLDGVRAPVGVHVQRLEAGPAGYHLDLETDGDVEVEVARLVDLGATEVAALPGGEPGRVLADPAGLPFCVTASGQPQQLDGGRDDARLHVVVFDVPRSLVEVEAAFWASVVTGQVVQPGPKYPEFTGVDGVRGVGGGLAVLVQALDGDASARVHVDLHVPDAFVRDTEVERLVSLGAAVAHQHGTWVVLRGPGDLLCCVVPDEP